MSLSTSFTAESVRPKLTDKTTGEVFKLKLDIPKGFAQNPSLSVLLAHFAATKGKTVATKTLFSEGDGKEVKAPTTGKLDNKAVAEFLSAAIGEPLPKEPKAK